MSQKKKKSVVGLDGSWEGKRIGGALSHFQAYVPTQKILSWHKRRRGPRSWRCPGIQEERVSEDGSGQVFVAMEEPGMGRAEKRPSD